MNPRIYSSSLLMAINLTLATPLAAATLTVTSTGDAVAADGQCTLREAVAAAAGSNNDCGQGEAGADEIAFDGSVSGRIDLIGGPLPVSESLAITGPGSATLTIDAARLSRIFDVQGGATSFSVAGLTLANGSTNGNGGAIRVAGTTATLVLEDVTISNAFASGSGAGLAIEEPAAISVHVSNSAFIGNEADAGAGALDLIPAAGGTAAAVTIEDTRFDANDSGASAAVMIACDQSPCAVYIHRSGFVENVGAHLDLTQQAMAAQNILAITDTGFYADLTAAESGGVRVSANAGAVRLLNNSFGPTVGTGSVPAALWLDTGAPSAIAVIAFNSFESPFGRQLEVTQGVARLKGNAFQDPDCEAGGTGSIESLGQNVVGGGAAFYEGACSLSSGAGDHLDDANLFAVQSPFDDGGSTPPYARPRVGSPVVDAVTDCTVPSTGPLPTLTLDRDQRGSARPVEGIDSPDCDAGAVETGPHLVANLSGSGSGVLRGDRTIVFDQSDVSAIGYDGSIQPNVSRSYYRWPGEMITLTPRPDGASTFGGFGGDCTGTDPCVLPDEPVTFSARFDLRGPSFELTVAVSGEQTGSVTSQPAGIDCPGTCSAFFDENTEVELSFSTGDGAMFVGWEEACTGRGLCRIDMTADRSVLAVFGGDLISRSGFEDGE